MVTILLILCRTTIVKLMRSLERPPLWAGAKTKSASWTVEEELSGDSWNGFPGLARSTNRVTSPKRSARTKATTMTRQSLDDDDTISFCNPPCHSVKYVENQKTSSCSRWHVL